MGYKYYDTPKGEDVHKKLWVATKYAGAAGLMISTADVMLHSYPKGYLQTIGRYGYITGPFIATAATFTIASNLLTSIRKKDDSINYFLGGVAAGSVVGAWRKSLMAGFVAAMALGTLAVVKKSSIDEGWVFMPPMERAFSGVNTQAYDFTLTAERPRNWTTGKQ